MVTTLKLSSILELRVKAVLCEADESRKAMFFGVLEEFIFSIFFDNILALLSDTLLSET